MLDGGIKCVVIQNRGVGLGTQIEHIQSSNQR